MKLVESVGVGPIDVPIPGEFAGASLKQPVTVRRSIRKDDHPRRIRRGLIEAPSLWFPMEPHLRGPSPANSPGPH